MRNVTLKQIRAFTTLARERSFTRAAARLNISQSALTLQIKDLEGELGLRLFDRSTRAVELTASAAGFLPSAQRLLDDLNGALDDLQALVERQKGSVVVAAGASVIALVIAPAVARLARSNPGIAVRILEEAGDNVAQRLFEGEADIGIATFIRPSDALSTTFLLKDRIGVLCPKTHPLAKTRRALLWRDLTRHPFATLIQGHAMRERLDHDPKIGPWIPRPVYEASSISALLALVESGAAIAILPSIAAHPAVGARLTFRPVEQPAMFRELYFVTRKRRTLTPAARLLVSNILAQLKELRSDRKLDIVPGARIDPDAL